MKLPKIRIRFGIRGLLIAVSLVGLAAAMLAREKRLADEQADIVSHLQEIGFEVGYSPHAEWLFGSREKPGIWRRLLGDDLFDSADFVIAYGDGEALLVKAAPFLRRLPTNFDLELGQSRITDAGVSTLTDIPKLKILALYCNFGIRGSTLDALRSAPALTRLDLSHSGISDSAIERLAKLQQVELLDVSNTALSIDELNRLRREMPRCVIRSAPGGAPNLILQNQ